MATSISTANYDNPQHARDISFLLNTYAQDKMGGGSPLPKYVQENLAQELSKVPNAFTVLCYVDKEPAGLINCLQGFSTFKCKPLINIHDVMVMEAFRGMGISQKMMDFVEEEARKRGSCKITLEVLEGNKPAQQAYLKSGFKGYALDPEMGHALFWEKPLL